MKYLIKMMSFLIFVFIYNTQQNVLLADVTSTVAPEGSSFALNPDQSGAIANSVNLYTGDVNLPLNLVSLPGINGLDVNVSVSYNSNVHNIVDTWNLEAPTGILGLGWSMDYEKIVVDHKNTGSRHDDDFYLVASGSSNKLVRIGDDGDTIYQYKTENFQPWKISYDPAYQKWEIIKENGIKFVYGDNLSARSTIQWGVKWGNWIGSTNVVVGQDQFPLVYNLSEIKDDWNNQITFTYEETSKTTGSAGGEEHTVASRLQKIVDVYGRSVTFIYDDKEPQEYQDPHFEPVLDPSPYQDHFETKFLDHIIVKNEDDQTMFTIEFVYEDVSNFLNTGNLTKRLLKSIKHKNYNNGYLPSMDFTYVPSGENNVGALKTIVTPEGGVYLYEYDQKIVEYSNLSKSISIKPNSNCKPQVWIKDDYVVVTWHDNIEDKLYVYSYEWDGGWVGEARGVVLDVSTHNNEQDFSIVLEKDFFAILASSKTETITKELKIYTRNRYERNSWQTSTYSCTMGGSDDAAIVSGNNFITIVSKTYGNINRYRLKDEDWIEDDLLDTFPTNPNDGDRFFLAGCNNYFIILDEGWLFMPDISPTTTSVYYLNENVDWEPKKTLSSLEMFSASDEAEKNWYCSNNSAVAMVDGITGFDFLYSWDENFQTFNKYPIGDLSDDSPVYIYGDLISINSPDNLNSHHLYRRISESSWSHSTGGASQSSITTTGGDFFAYHYDPSFPCNLREFNPYSNSWNDHSISYNIPVAGYNFYVSRSSTDAYVGIRNVDGTWANEVYFNPSMTMYHVKTGIKYFILQGTTGSKVGIIKNGVFSLGNIYDLAGEGFNTFDDHIDNPNLVGSDIFITFSTSKFEDASSFTLHKVFKNSISGQIIDYPVKELIASSGTNSISTFYEYEELTATIDPSGNIAQYNEITVTPVNLATKPYGFTKHYFFNGLSRSRISFPATDDYTNASDNTNLLKGMPYETVAYTSDNAPVYDPVSTSTQYWWVNSDGNKYARVKKVVNTVHGTPSSIISSATTLYNDFGQVTETHTTNTDGTIKVTQTEYAHSQYSEMLEKNMLTAVCKQITKESTVNKASSITTYKDWGSGKWGPFKTFAWLDFNGDGLLSEFDNWSGDEDPSPYSEWKITSRLTNLGTRGQVLEQSDGHKGFSCVKWGYNHTRPVASISNAKDSECAYLGFEAGSLYEDGWGSGDGGSISQYHGMTGEYGVVVNNSSGNQYGPTKDFYESNGLDADCGFVASVWVNGPGTARLSISINNSSDPNQRDDVYCSGGEGWERLEAVLTKDQVKTYMDGDDSIRVFVANNNTISAYFDDLRFHPLDASMTTSTYPGYDSYSRVACQSNANNIPIYTYLDDFDRPIRTENADGQVLATTSYYNSREENADVYNPDDPNYVESSAASVTTKSFTNGLGQTIQTQTASGDYDLLSQVQYNGAGKVEKAYEPRKAGNPDHQLIHYNMIDDFSSASSINEPVIYEDANILNADASLQVNSGAVEFSGTDKVVLMPGFHVTVGSGAMFNAKATDGLWNYTETVYEDSPAMRVVKQTHPDNKFVTYDYSNASFEVGGSTLFRTTVTDELNNSSSTFVDGFGNTVGGTGPTYNGDVVKWSKQHNVLGNVVSSKAPNHYENSNTGFTSNIEYNTLGQIEEQQTPDEGISYYIYDEVGRLKYSKNAEQHANGWFTVYYYDSAGRITLIGEERNYSGWWVNGAPIGDNDYGIAGWVIKKYYDEDFTGSEENFCHGQLTKTEVNGVPSYVTKYIYNRDGLLTDKHILIDNGNQISEKVVRHEYDIWGRKTQLIYPSGKTVMKYYDELGQIEDLIIVE